MNDRNLLGPWIRRFLLEYLVGERNLARNTQTSYRDTLTLLLPFASKRTGIAIDRMTVEDLSPAIVRQFLDHLERDRQCTGATRNQRLGTIHSLARFIGMRSPVLLSWCTEMRLVPFKKTDKNMIGYLEKVEMDELLRQPDRGTAIGLRDYVLLLFLYNSVYFLFQDEDDFPFVCRSAGLNPISVREGLWMIRAQAASDLNSNVA
jgi:site-specific recombinase XerD